MSSRNFLLALLISEANEIGIVTKMPIINPIAIPTFLNRETYAKILFTTKDVEMYRASGRISVVAQRIAMPATKAIVCRA